jgi:hypothetical protein
VLDLTTADREVLSDAARQTTPNAPARTIHLRTDDVMLATRVLELSDEARYRVSVGLSTRDISLTPPEMLATMVAVAPMLLGISIAFAYIIAGRAFRPIDRIIDQVEAITDGRSLHRRLAIAAPATSWPACRPRSMR